MTPSSLRARLRGPGLAWPSARLRRLRRDLLAVEVGERGRHPADEDYLRFHTSRYAITLGLLAPELELLGPGARLLDIGSQPAFATLLQDRFPGLVYRGFNGGGRLDEAPRAHRRAELHTWLKGRAHRYALDLGLDLERDPLPYPDASFDVVLFLEVIEHLIRDPVFALGELARVLRPGGVLLLTTDNAANFIKIAKLLALRPIDWPYPEVYFGDRHNREYLAAEVRRLLQELGYRQVDVATFNMLPYLPEDGAGRCAGYLLGNLLTRLPVLRRYRRHVAARALKGEPRPGRPGWLFKLPTA